MQIKTITDHLIKCNIPSFSVTMTATELGKQDLSLNQALEQIETLTQLRPNVIDIHEANLMYHYLIQDGLRLHNQGVENVDTMWIMESTLNKAKKFKAKNPYVFATEEGVSNVRANVEVIVKQKKGWKLARAIELHKANPNMIRKDLISLFMKELDMSLAGSTTYLHNINKKLPNN